MINGGQIAQGAITDNKVGKHANIKHSKLDKANEGEVLVAQGDGRLKAVRISGDARMSTTGKLTVKVPDVEISIDKDVVKKTDLKEGKTLVGGPTKPEEVAVGTGSNAIPQRDSSGNLKAETADQATNATTATSADNADKLDSQEGTFYTDVTNHTAGTATSLGTPAGSTGLSGFNTKQTVPKVVYTSDSEGGNSSANILIPHNFGYYPQVSVMSRTVIPDSDPVAYKYIECDVEVENETTQTKIHTSEQGLELKIILS